MKKHIKTAMLTGVMLLVSASLSFAAFEIQQVNYQDGDTIKQLVVQSNTEREQAMILCKDTNTDLYYWYKIPSYDQGHFKSKIKTPITP